MRSCWFTTDEISELIICTLQQIFEYFFFCLMKHNFTWTLKSYVVLQWNKIQKTKFITNSGYSEDIFTDHLPWIPIQIIWEMCEFPQSSSTTFLVVKIFGLSIFSHNFCQFLTVKKCWNFRAALSPILFHWTHLILDYVYNMIHNITSDRMNCMSTNNRAWGWKHAIIIFVCLFVCRRWVYVYVLFIR